MSHLRVRRASSRGGAACLLVLGLSLLLSGCGSGESAPASIPPGIELPVVGTLGRQPGGPGTIVVDITADGRITIGGKGPLSLRGLREELVRRTADPAWREPDRSSLKILLVNADASLPWTVAQWTLQCAADPNVGIYRTFFGARSRGHGAVGALGCALPKDHWGWGDLPPRLRVLVASGEGAPSAPEDLLAPLRAAAGERPLSDVALDLFVRGNRHGEIPTGFMVRLVGVALRAGVRHITFEGAPLSREFEDDDVQGLLDHVAHLRARMGSPVLQIDREVVPPLPSSEVEPAPQGRLATLYGFGVEKEEPKPDREKRSVTISSEVPEEEETPEEDDPTWVAPEPVIKDEEIVDYVETDDDLPFEESLGDEGLVDAPFVGPPPSLPEVHTAFPSRRKPGEADDPVERALRWLAAHQSPDGGWEAAGFGRWCDGKALAASDRAGGAGLARHDVGVTGLALCAFLGVGYTNRGKHPYAKTVSRGLRHLKNVQDAEGCFGPRTHTRFVYDHAAASLAILQAYGLTGSPIFKSSAQKALDFILLCRNPTLGWRYGVKPGESDTSATAWMAMPLLVARWIDEDAVRRERPSPFGLDDDAAFEGIRAWLDAVTEPTTGRAGYVDRGSGPDRPADLAAWFPPERSESTTAAAVLLRLFLGEDPRQSEAVLAGAALLEARPPSWDPEAGTIDPVYWYFGTLATARIGGSPWAAWNTPLFAAVRGTQRTDGDACGVAGSWDPAGPWAREGGRVASTALLALCLEVASGEYRIRPR